MWLLTLVVAGAFIVAPNERVRSGNVPVISHFGSAVVDGVVSPGEWGDEACVKSTQTVGAVTYHATLCETNDAMNDYYLFTIDDLTPAAASDPDSVTIVFDNENDGKVDCASPPGDLLEVALPGPPAPGALFDAAYCYFPNKIGQFLVMTDVGANDGQGASALSKTGAVFELSHPLMSGDASDYALQVHDTVGFCAIYRDSANPEMGDIEITYSGQFVDLPHPCFLFPSGGGGLVRKVSAWDSVLKKIERLVAVCAYCPPDPRRTLLNDIRSAQAESLADHADVVVQDMHVLIDHTRRFLRSGRLRPPLARRLIVGANDVIALIGTQPPPPSSSPTPSPSPTAVPTATPRRP
jgi:hypothetical protein